jgi:GT2 family glycosyltransferase
LKGHPPERGGDKPVDVSVVIVSWNVRDLLRGCIESILSPAGPTVEIIVIDNASRDGSADMVTTEFPQVDLVTSAVNLGFARGNNLGLARATGRYVFFLNPDTILRVDAMQRMVDFLDDHPGFDMVGPRLVSANGVAQSSVRLPSIPMTLFNALYLHRAPVIGRLAGHRQSERDPSRNHEVEAIVGAAMLARRVALNELRGFDESFLYTCEDLDLCLRLRGRGSRIFYLADAEVIHFVEQSSAQAWARSGAMSVLSTGWYFQRSRGTLHALVFRLIVQVVQMPIMVAVGVVKAVLHRGRPNEVRDRLKLATAVWRWRVSD